MPRLGGNASQSYLLRSSSAPTTTTTQVETVPSFPSATDEQRWNPSSSSSGGHTSLEVPSGTATTTGGGTSSMSGWNVTTPVRSRSQGSSSTRMGMGGGGGGSLTTTTTKTTSPPGSPTSSRGGGGGGSSSSSSASLRRRLRMFSSDDTNMVLPHHVVHPHTTSSPMRNTSSGGVNSDNHRSSSRSSSRSPPPPPPHSSVQTTISIPLAYITHALILLTILCVMLDSRTKVERATEHLAFYKAEEARVNAKIAEFESRATELTNDVTKLRDENKKLEVLKKERLDKIHMFEEEANNALSVQEEHSRLVSRDEGIRKQVENLQKRIQMESRREVMDKFGEGPHVVEMVLDMPPADPNRKNGKTSSRGEEDNNTVEIELASTDLMPHSVQLFLEQVSRKLWDGCAFVWNPTHLILITPHVRPPSGGYKSTEEEKIADDRKRDEFVQSGYASVTFQEYNDQYPHNKWTVGFAGRPGGPNFYVNLYDNTRIHGPGGQVHNHMNDVGHEADPCFGTVVKGREVLERLHRMPNEGGGVGTDGWKKNSLKEPVYIKSARILKPPPPKKDDEEQEKEIEEEEEEMEDEDVERI